MHVAHLFTYDFPCTKFQKEHANRYQGTVLHNLQAGEVSTVGQLHAWLQQRMQDGSWADNGVLHVRLSDFQLPAAARNYLTKGVDSAHTWTVTTATEGPQVRGWSKSLHRTKLTTPNTTLTIKSSLFASAGNCWWYSMYRRNINVSEDKVGLILEIMAYHVKVWRVQRI
jgi:hypothetical protein